MSPRTTLAPTRRKSRGLGVAAGLPMLALGVFLSGCITPAAAQLSDGLFERHEVVTGAAKGQTVLSGFLLGGAVAELAVVSLEENDDRRLRIYALGNGGWEPSLDTALRPGVLFVDVADLGGRDRLLTYEPGRLSWFDPESATERALVAVAADFVPPTSGQIPHVDVTQDVNGDDRDDLVVPDVDGFWVFVQGEGGAFADPVKLGRSAGVGWTLEADGYRYNPWDQGRIHEMDYNRDGRGDLVFWNDHHFAVHLQDERGLFASEAVTFTTVVAFDSDDRASLAAPQGVRHRRLDHMPTGDMTGSVLHSLGDLNGDGVADLVVFSLDIQSMWSVHSAYEVHFGAPTPDGGIRFAPEVGTAIRSNGVPFEVGPHDFDRDGQVDMMFATIEIGIFKTIRMIVGGLLTRSVPMRLGFYRMDGGMYPDRPDAIRKIKTDSLGKSGERAARWPSVLIGDVNGDTRPDLLLGRSRKELRVFLGVPGPDLFARQPHKVAVAMPREEYTWLVDLNRDGKQDVLMHHPSPTGPQRVTMLIAR